VWLNGLDSETWLGSCRPAELSLTIGQFDLLSCHKCGDDEPMLTGCTNNRER
jgi:hypothetical protein